MNGGVEELSEEVQEGITEETQETLNKIVGKMQYKVNSKNIDNEKAEAVSNN